MAGRGGDAELLRSGHGERYRRAETSRPVNCRHRVLTVLEVRKRDRLAGDETSSPILEVDDLRVFPPTGGDVTKIDFAAYSEPQEDNSDAVADPVSPPNCWNRRGEMYRYLIALRPSCFIYCPNLPVAWEVAIPERPYAVEGNPRRVIERAEIEQRLLLPIWPLGISSDPSSLSETRDGNCEDRLRGTTQGRNGNRIRRRRSGLIRASGTPSASRGEKRQCDSKN